MAEYGTREWYEGTQERLIKHIAQGEMDLALQLYIENKAQIPRSRRRLYLAYIQKGRSGLKSYKRIMLTVVRLIAINILTQPIFAIQIQDAFSFLADRFFYYNYFAAWIPSILNVYFLMRLAYQWHRWVTLPNKLFKLGNQPASRVGIVAMLTLVAVLVAVQMAPLVTDLPLVLDGGFYMRTISQGEHVAMIYGEVIKNTDREDVARVLRETLRDEYGLEYSDDDFPVHFFKRGKSLGVFDIYLIYIDAEKEYYHMSKQQYYETSYSDEVYPIVIKYLRRSKIILRIDNYEDMYP